MNVPVYNQELVMKKTFDRFHVALSKKQCAVLTRLAKARGMTLAEITRQAIEIGIDELQRQNELARRGRGLKKIKALHARILAHNGGKPLEINPVEDLQSIRDERVRQFP